MKKTQSITRLDYWRRQKGLTTQQLAGLLGVKQPTASRYCRGRQHPQKQETRDALIVATDGACNAANYADLVDPQTGAPVDQLNEAAS